MRATPSGFLPVEDQGVFFVEIGLPEAASVNRTTEVMGHVNDIVAAIPGVENVATVTGFSFIDGLAKSNSGFAIAMMKPFDERTDPSMSVDAAIAATRQQLAAIPEAIGIPFNLPPIIGLGTGAGYELQLLDLQGGTPVELGATAGGLVTTLNSDDRLAGNYTTFSANTPQLYLNVDREKLQTLGVDLSSLFLSLQTNLGSYYVNDINLYGRTWQVKLQAEQQYRDSADDIGHIHVRNADGEMVPVRAIATPEMTLGPQSLVRYNNYRSVTVSGNPAPGTSSGEALAAVEELATENLPKGYSFEWTGTAAEEIESAGTTTIVLILAVLFAYLFLVALYESWTIPIAVLLSVTFAVTGR